MSVLPEWVQWVSALGPMTIAAAVAYIAWQQWRTNRDSLRERLFDRRLDVYTRVLAAMSDVLRQRYQANPEGALAQASRDAEFLFGKEVVNKIDDVQETVRQAMYHYYLIDSDEEDGKKHVQLEAKKARYVSDQFEVLHSLVAPYLSFKDRR